MGQIWPKLGHNGANVGYIWFIFLAELLRVVWIILTLSTAVQDGRRAPHSKQTRLLNTHWFPAQWKVSNNVCLKPKNIFSKKQKQWLLSHFSHCITMKWGSMICCMTTIWLTNEPNPTQKDSVLCCPEQLNRWPTLTESLSHSPTRSGHN